MKRYNLKRIGIFTLLLGSLVGTAAAEAPQEGEGWRLLFDGETLNGWEFRGKEGDNAPTFDAEDGAIVGRTRMPSNPTAFLATTEQFKDFELIFECKVDKDLNSGVQLRSTPKGTMIGAQVEIQNGLNKTGYIFGQGLRTWLSKDIPKSATLLKANEWNHFRVVAKGKNIKTWLNGQPLADATHDKIELEGVIALQLHGYPRIKGTEAKEILSSSWRNIKIRKID
ncbi:MAG: DUF1080 domain-containing protein [Verrucomicrobiota bacterium]